MDWWIVAAVVASTVNAGSDPWAHELAELDLQRALAFAEGSADGLSKVYANDEAAEADAAVIDSYAARGGRIEGAVMSVHEVAVSSITDDRVVIDVDDQLGPAMVRWDDGGVTALPRDQVTRRTVVLTATDDGWRISSVQPREPS